MTITHGPASVIIYRVKAPSTASKFAYTIVWREPGNGRKKMTKASLTDAKDEAQLKAQQLATGITGASEMGAADLQIYSQAKAIAEKQGVPLIAALEEWAKAREMIGGALLEACEAFANSRIKQLERIKLSAAIDRFIAAKDKAGGQGERTYRAKLKPLLDRAGDVYLDTITVHQFNAYLEFFGDPVTRNDLRKRTVTMCRWAQRSGFLPRDVKPEIEQTERAKESATEIGIISPEIYKTVLDFIRAKHPEYLAATVLAGFCGLRSDEIHGKRNRVSETRADMPRQRWQDIDLAKKSLWVSTAKNNTPSHRYVPIPPAAVQWLKLCYNREGYVCIAGAMERVRELCRAEEIDLPENCFRHSFISYEIAVSGDKSKTSTIAGNSPAEIDRRYRRPMQKPDGVKWFAIKPS